jgi:hypothetical protein
MTWCVCDGPSALGRIVRLGRLEMGWSARARVRCVVHFFLVEARDGDGVLLDGV